METLGITLTDLFPQLRSYDGGVSYLPLSPYIEVSENVYNYIDADHEIICLLQPCAINRYNSYGQVISNSMPNELSIDEFYNTSELYFLKDDLSYWEGPDVDLETLPPNFGTAGYIKISTDNPVQSSSSWA